MSKKDPKTARILIISPAPSVTWLQSDALPFKVESFWVSHVKAAFEILRQVNIDCIIFEQTAIQDVIHFINQLEPIIQMLAVLLLGAVEDKGVKFLVKQKKIRKFFIQDPQERYKQNLIKEIKRILNEKSLSQLPTKKKGELVLTSVLDGIAILNLQGKVLFVNPALTCYFQQNFSALMGRNVQTLLSLAFATFTIPWDKKIQEIKKTFKKQTLGCYHLKVGNVDIGLIEFSLSPFLSSRLQLEGVYLLVSPKVERKLPRTNIHYLSIQDDLTGVLTRQAFLHRVELALAYSKRYQTQCAVLCVDIDNFNKINAELGLHYGNELLLKIAQRFQLEIKKGDVLARVESDQFYFLIKITRPSEAGKLAVQLKQVLLAPFELSAQRYFFTASIGIALFTHETQSANELMTKAFVAMEHVKQKGKNHFQYHDYSAKVKNILNIHKDLSGAIKDNQLDLTFHPWYCVRSGQMKGATSSIRWLHPKQGILIPNYFLPSIKRNKLSFWITQWVLDHACECLSLWQHQQLMPFILNLSIDLKDFLHKDFMPVLRQSIEKHRINPGTLQLALTGSLFSFDILALAKRMQQLGDTGVTLAMDDFNSGFACLSIPSLWVNVIKLNRTCTAQYYYEQRRWYALVLSKLIQNAQRKHIQILAQGIETEAQANFFQEMGCQFLQGFLLAKPMSFQQFTEYMLRQANPSTPVESKEWRCVK